MPLQVLGPILLAIRPDWVLAYKLSSRYCSCADPGSVFLRRQRTKSCGIIYSAYFVSQDFGHSINDSGQMLIGDKVLDWQHEPSELQQSMDCILPYIRFNNCHKVKIKYEVCLSDVLSNYRGLW